MLPSMPPVFVCGSKPRPEGDEKKRFSGRRNWRAYLETIKGAVILQGEDMVRDGKDVALSSYEASQVYCFPCGDRA